MEPINFGRPIAAATPDVCAAFQREALTLPRNWRKRYPNSRPPDQVGTVRANTVVKWSRTLQAAFQRANRNAGKKCVRGVLPPEKLLTDNPWTQFTWIGGEERPKRRFDADELISVLDWLAANWPGVTVASCLAKLLLWSQCRRMEAVTLRWEDLREIGAERHFDIVGKWNVEKWFRVPEALHTELQGIRTDSSFVFAAYTGQLHQFHERSATPRYARQVKDEFDPGNLADWFHEQLVAWSATLPKGHATTHVFRKTGLQCAWSGESLSSQVARDARVSKDVMMKHYVSEDDPERRAESNRNYQRIAAALRPDVAARYGYVVADHEPLEEKLQAATEARDWELVSRLSAELDDRQGDRQEVNYPVGQASRRSGQARRLSHRVCLNLPLAQKRSAG